MPARAGRLGGRPSQWQAKEASAVHDLLAEYAETIARKDEAAAAALAVSLGVDAAGAG